MRDDIEGGIKNALDRGATLEQAVRSFINAGYNESEVRKAAKVFGEGAISMTSPQGQAQTPLPNSQITQLQSVQPPGQTPVRAQATTRAQLPTIRTKTKRFSVKIFILIIVLLILLGVLAATIFFRGSIIDFLTDLL